MTRGCGGNCPQRRLPEGVWWGLSSEQWGHACPQKWRARQRHLLLGHDWDFWGGTRLRFKCGKRRKRGWTAAKWSGASPFSSIPGPAAGLERLCLLMVLWGRCTEAHTLWQFGCFVWWQWGCWEATTNRAPTPSTPTTSLGKGQRSSQDCEGEGPERGFPLGFCHLWVGSALGS